MNEPLLPPGAALGILFFLLLLSAFFSGSETALTRARAASLRAAAKQGDRGARKAEKLIARPERMLSTILLGNNFVNIAASSLATAVFVERFGEAGILYATVAMTVVVLILAEILPKTIAVAHAEAIAARVAPPLGAIQWLLSPVVSALMGVIGMFKRLLRVPDQAETAITHRELVSIIHLGRESGLLDPARGQMLHGSLRLHEIPVKALMTPRRDMIALDGGTSASEALRIAAGAPFSRYPVHGKDNDDLIGIVHLRDMIAADPDARLADLARERAPSFVPATKSALRQLIDFQRHHQHMAIVVDEFGDIEGLITLEDIIEEIVGEIRDESDQTARPELWPQEDGSLIAAGTAPIHDINMQLNLELPEDGATTIGGLIVQTLGDQPAGGVCLQLAGARLEVLRMEGDWIERVRIRVQPEEEAA